MSTIKRDVITDIFDYNPDTGIFKYKVDMPRNVKAGYIPKQHDKDGYQCLNINGKQIRAHRAAFLFMTGKYPENFVDHINHVRNDNRWCNLRECSRKENEQNQKMFLNNTSGFTGVSYNKKMNRWHCYINIDKKRINIGYFKDKENAINARIEANIKHGFHANHGKEIA